MVAADKKAIVFDFDGTIADSIPVMLELLHDLLHRGHTREDISRLRGYSSREVLHALHIPLWQAYFLIVKARRQMAAQIGTIPIVTGMDQAIRELAVRHRLYIVSSNSAQNVRTFLERIQLDGCFVAVYGGVAPWRKSRALRRMLRANNLDPAVTWYIGDEDIDITAAHRAGMRGAAVSWGFSNMHVLEQKRPEALVFSSDELVRAVSGSPES